MAFTVLNFETNDYEAWKSMFDSDPAGRRQAGKGHIVSRNADNPNEVFVRVEFDSVDDGRPPFFLQAVAHRRETFPADPGHCLTMPERVSIPQPPYRPRASAGARFHG